MANILYIANGRSFYSNNPPRKIEKLVETLRSLGHEVYFISGGDIIGGGRSRRLKVAGHAGETQSPLIQYLRNSISELRDCIHDRKLYKAIEAKYGLKNIDLIWERSSRLHYAGLRFAKNHKLHYVMEWKDNLCRYENSLLLKHALAMEQNKIQQANNIVVESHVLAKAIAKENNLHDDKFIVAFNAADAAQFYRPDLRNTIRRKLNIPADTFVIGYVGSYAFYHNVHILCDVVDELIRIKRADNIMIVLIGDGNGRKLFESRAKLLNVEAHFEVVGNVPKDEVPGYLSAFDCAILPDSTEIICPVKVQEYMAAGLPVLLPNYEANLEIITNRETGLFFEARDHQSIAACIRCLSNDVKLVSSLGKSARKVVTEKFSWASTWGAALNDVLKKMDLK